MIFSIKVFVTLLDYLKIPQVTILGDLHVLRVLASSSGFLYNSIELFSQSREIVNL
jgi:hypothetical protein